MLSALWICYHIHSESTVKSTWSAITRDRVHSEKLTSSKDGPSPSGLYRSELWGKLAESYLILSNDKWFNRRHRLPLQRTKADTKDLIQAKSWLSSFRVLIGRHVFKSLPSIIFGFVIPKSWAGQAFSCMGDPRSQIPGILRSIIDANRMSKMPSLPSRNCIYILLVRLFPVSISKTLWKRLFERGALHLARIFYQMQRQTEGLMALRVLGVTHLRNVVKPSILNALG